MNEEIDRDQDDYSKLDESLNEASKIIFRSEDIPKVLDNELGKTTRNFLKEAARDEDYNLFFLEEGADPVFTTEPYLEHYDEKIFVDTEEAYQKAIQSVKHLGEMPENHLNDVGRRYIPSELETPATIERKGTIKDVLKANPNIKHNKVENRYEWKK